MSAQQSPQSVASRFVSVNGTRIHYLESGFPTDSANEASTTVTLLIHGWPTHSFLWRNLMPQLGTGGWTVALDLPGYGQSDKPTDAHFSFNYWAEFIDGFITAIGASKVNLVVHDLGGPVGLIWAARYHNKLNHLVLLNTLVYSRLNWSARLFIMMTWLPGISRWMTRPASVRSAMEMGTKRKLSHDIKARYAAPYKNPDARRCLLTSVRHLDLRDAVEIEKVLPRLSMPVTAIYGENDIILPDIARTMARVKRDIPHATVQSLKNCGHFLQEDEPEKLAQLIHQALWPKNAL